MAKIPRNAEKVKCDRPRTDGPTDQQTNGPTKRAVESRSTRLKSCDGEHLISPLVINFSRMILMYMMFMRDCLHLYSVCMSLS